MTPSSGELGVGVIGVGQFGREHLAAWSAVTGCRVVALLDADVDQAGSVAAQLPGSPRVHTSLDDLVSDPDVAIVDVVTPENAHLEPTLAALGAGRSVLCEKPLSLDLGDLSRMEAAAASSAGVLMPGHLLRFDARYRAVKRSIEDGELGRPVFASFRRCGNRTVFPDVWSRAAGPYVASIHDIDLALWYFGSPARRVQATKTELIHPGVPDSYAFHVAFADGAAAAFEASCLPPSTWPAITASTLVLGSEGAASVDHPGIGLAVDSQRRQEPPDTHVIVRDGLPPSGALVRELGYFASCVRAGETPDVVTVEDARRAVEVADAVIEALDTGGPVDL